MAEMPEGEYLLAIGPEEGVHFFYILDGVKEYTNARISDNMFLKLPVSRAIISLSAPAVYNSVSFLTILAALRCSGY